MLARIQQEKHLAEKRHREDRRRSQAQMGMVPPSPALVRNGSRHGAKVPAALTPGQLTPHSAQAQVHIPVISNQRSPGIAHPYAAAGIGVGHEYSQHQEHFKNSALAQPQPYGRQSPMVPSFAGQSPALRGVRVAENTGGIGQDYQQADPPPKPFLLRILTCRC